MAGGRGDCWKGRPGSAGGSPLAPSGRLPCQLPCRFGPPLGLGQAAQDEGVEGDALPLGLEGEPFVEGVGEPHTELPAVARAHVGLRGRATFLNRLDFFLGMFGLA